MTSTTLLVPGEHLTFVGNFLEASDEALKRIDRKALSASTAKSMSPKSCHARFAAEKILPRDEDPFGAAPIGTAAHAVLERLMELPPKKRTTQAALDLLLADAEEQWPDQIEGVENPDRIRWTKAVWAKVTGLWKIEDPTTVDVVKTEWRIVNIDIEGVPFIGFIDRTDRDENGALKVVDYKSGKAKITKSDLRWGDDHGDQIRLYAAALEELTGETVGSGHLYYIGTGQAREVDLDPDKMEQTIADFRTSWAELKADVAAGAFEAKAGPLCGWCPLVSLCPAAKLDGRTAKIEGLPTAKELGIKVVSATADSAHQEGDLDETDEDDFSDPEDPMAYDPSDDFDEFFADDEPTAADAPEPDEDEAEDDDAVVAPEPTPEPAVRQRKTRTVRKPPVAPVAAVPAPIDGPEPIFGEDKSWIAKADGLPNANGYAAMGAFGMGELAITTLAKAGAPLSIKSITALAQTFSVIVADAQEALTGSRDPMAGSGTRMRGALRTTLENLPAPIGGTAEQWRTWVKQTTRRCIVLGQVAHTLLAYPAPDEPYLTLAADEDGLAA